MVGKLDAGAGRRSYGSRLVGRATRMSLDECRRSAETFVRRGLPVAAQAEGGLPTVPRFSAKVKTGPGKRIRYVETGAPNWWQLGKDRNLALLESPAGQELVRELGATVPFSACIGKMIWIDQRQTATNYASAGEIALEVLTSYLFAAGAGRWNAAAFKKVWDDCVAYFDPAQTKLEYVLYAPIGNLSGIKRRLTLSSDLVIRRLPPEQVAHLASLNTRIAGMTEEHRLTLWTSLFFVERCSFDKTLRDVNDVPTSLGTFRDDWWCHLNEEVAMLRSLLGPGPCVPSYALIRDGYPRDGTEGPGSRELPWRYRLLDRTSFTRRQLKQYSRRRAAFLALRGSPAWEIVAGSMRRFAIAWENTFPADALADIVSAVESLVVDDKTEVSYKVRVRTSNLLGMTTKQRQHILTDMRKAYEYRSKVAHGAYVFDDPREWQTAKRLKRAKGKHGNPFHDVNEIHRLKYAVAGYYRDILVRLIDRSDLSINWSDRGL